LLADALEQFRRRLNDFYQTNTVATVVSPQPGDFCCCQYDIDALYYRARIVRKYASNQYYVSVVVVVVLVVVILVVVVVVVVVW